MKIRFLNSNKSFSNLRVIVSLLAVLALVLCGAFSARAQVTTAAVRGTVMDEQGAAIADAEVSMTSAETGFTRSMKSGVDGQYNFPDLPLGTYRIHVTHSGFKNETAVKPTPARVALKPEETAAVASGHAANASPIR